MSAHDDFSLHDDASLAGSVPATNKEDAPAKPPQIITTNTLSNIKLPVLQKDDYDTWNTTKGVPHPLSGDYTPREQEDIDDSLYEYGKYGPQPQTPSPTKSDASSTVYSTCQSNDSDGELGAVSDPLNDHIPIPSIEQVTIATQKTQPHVPKPKQTVVPSYKIGINEWKGN
ncbi:hypothetical protein Tco_0130144 [Tanacetum coccineum]